jgi:hypothetical protein
MNDDDDDDDDVDDLLQNKFAPKLVQIYLLGRVDSKERVPG